MRQGGNPRLPLELALVKVTRPAADLSRESIAYRLEQLEHRPTAAHAPPSETAAPETESEPAPAPRAAVTAPPSVELEQLQEAWQRTVIPAVEERSIPAASVLREAQPTDLAADTLTVEFPPSARFHRELAEDPRNATLLERKNQSPLCTKVWTPCARFAMCSAQPTQRKRHQAQSGENLARPS